MLNKKSLIRLVGNVSAILLVFLASPMIYAQDTKHNFEMGPQITNCDSLHLEEMDESDKIRSIEKATFRFNQNFKLNRPDGFQGAWFYSCDNESGYLIALIDSKKHLYKSVTKEQWDSFISSGDFLNFIKENFNQE